MIMRFMLATALMFVTISSLEAGVAAFETGGVTPANGVVNITFRPDKSHRISMGNWIHLGVMEVQITMTDGDVKRQTMLCVGTHTLKAPMPMEVVEVVGAIWLLGLFCGLIILGGSRSRGSESGVVPAGCRMSGSGDSEAEEPT
jgi:hypothetical protein